MKDKQNKTIRYFAHIVFCFMMVILFLAMYQTEARAVGNENGRKVKVAFYPMQGYHEKDKNGEYGGVEVEYLQMLCTYTNWDIEYVECNTWMDALKLLDKKEVDLVGASQYTEERSKKYLYATVPNNYMFSAVATKADSDVAFEDFAKMKNLHYGIVDGYVRTKECYDYFKENGISNPNITVYPTSQDLHEALENDEIDALIHTYMEIRNGQRVIGRFAANATYFMSYYGNEELVKELNEAITDVKIQHPMLEHDLMEKYYKSKWDDSILLTSAEVEYLNQTDEIVVGYVDGYFPFNYEEDGKLKGIVIDLLNEKNLPIRYVNTGTVEVGLQALSNNEIDVMTHLTDTELLSSYEDLQAICNYADVPFVLVTEKENTSEVVSKIAVPSDFSDEMEKLLVTEGKEILYKKDIADSFNEIETGNADAAFATAYVSEYFIRTIPKYNDLTISSVLNGNIPIQMVINRNADDYMKSVLVKTMGHISEKEITQYMLENVNPSEISLKALISKNSESIMMIMVVVMILIVLVTLHIINDSKQIQKLLYKDASMDIWNLHYFIKKVDEIRKKNTVHKYAIVYTNISRMRQYHLVYGRMAAVRIYECLRQMLKAALEDESEVCARVSDDHFLLLLKYEDKDELMNRLQQLVKEVEMGLREITDNQLQLEVGVAPDISGNTEVSILVEYAIQVLDGDKVNAGKIHVYNDEYEAQMKACHKKEKLLDTISIEDHFEVYYQNKVDIRNEEIVGAEALIRFKDPDDHDSIKSPGYFISYMEQIGRVVEIDFFVLKRVCMMLRRRMDAGLKVVPISCNFSRLHFIEAGFADRFEKITAEYNLPKNLIEVEITETMVIEREYMEVVMENFNELKARGIPMAIDDFGSGYSSLGVFEHVPAAVIKMDRSFMVNHDNEDRQLKIMKGIVKLSEDLETDVVCEGVETEEDVKLMRNIAAYVAQGYFYSKPRPESEFEGMLDAEKK